MKIRLKQNVLWDGRICNEGQVIETEDENLLNFGEALEEPKAEEPAQEAKPKTTRTRRTVKKE